MKKVILIATALVMVLSGVAAVSAYEAHMVNVKAKVENAIELSSYTALDFGTVFPEEWLDRHTTVQFSSSFNEQETRHNVDFEIWAGCKWLDAGPDNITDTADDNYYPWLGEALYIELNTGLFGYVGSAPGSCPGVVKVMDYSGGSPVALVGTINDTSPQTMDIAVWLDVPVFEDFYKPETDVDNKSRADWADLQSGLAANIPSLILPPGNPPGTPQTIEMGVDLIIQVVDIY